MPAAYLGRTNGFRTIARQPLTHSLVAGLWIAILAKYFIVDDYFIVQPEYRVPGGRPDLAVTQVPVHPGLPQSTAIIVEIKPENSPETWDTARKQAFDYVRNGLRKRAHSTMFIIAKGKQFMMFEVPGSQMANGATWTSLGINNNGTQHPDTDPYS